MVKDQQAVAARPPAPDAASLHEAALAYLASYAATQASLVRVLQRRIDRWSRLAQAGASETEAIAAQAAVALQAAREVVARLAAAGAVNDAAFAESRVRSLARSGRSRRAIGAHLASKGVASETQRQLLPTDDGETEFAAALVLARRRRIGPFRSGNLPDAAGRRRELAILARAGFPQDIARRALDADAAAAEAAINRLRR